MSPQVPLLTSPGWAMVEGAPELRAGVRVVAGDEAAFVLEALAAVDAADDDAVRDARPARLGEALPVIGPRGLPDRLARPRVEGDDCRVVGGQVDLVPVEGDAARRAPALRVLGDTGAGAPSAARRWPRRGPGRRCRGSPGTSRRRGRAARSGWCPRASPAPRPGAGRPRCRGPIRSSGV